MQGKSHTLCATSLAVTVTVIPLLINLLEWAPVMSLIVRLIVTVFGILNTPWGAFQALPWGGDTLRSLPGSPRGAEESNTGLFSRLSFTRLTRV